MRRRFVLAVACLAVGACERASVTYSDVAPIIAERCGSCHNPTGPAPFSLLGYADVVDRLPHVVDAVRADRMPPWGAHDASDCDVPLGWKHDWRLTAEEKRLLLAWATHPTAPEVEEPYERTASPLELEAPDAELVLPSIDVFGAHDTFTCAVIDPGLDADHFVTRWAFVPGNRSIAHHAVVEVDPERANAAYVGQGFVPCEDLSPAAYPIAAWHPGAASGSYADGAGARLPAGSLLVVTMHYGPAIVDPKSDQSRFQVQWQRQAPARLVAFMGFGDAVSTDENGDGLLPGPHDPPGGALFLVPHGDALHTETMASTIPAGAPVRRIYGIRVHAHLAAVDVRVRRVRDGVSTCLLRDRWNFHWQQEYQYDAAIDDLPTLAPGDRLLLECHYLNSEQNRVLANELAYHRLPFTDIVWGPGTLDEMCSAHLSVLDG